MSLDEYYDESLDYYYDSEDSYIIHDTIVEIWNNCVLESLKSINDVFVRILFVNFCFGCLTAAVKIPEYLYHILSGLSGLYLIWCTLQTDYGKTVVFVCFTLSYLLLLISRLVYHKINSSNCNGSEKLQSLKNANIIKYSLILILVLCEYYFIDPTTWLEIRGPVMIFAMKLISLGADIETNEIQFPNVLQYFGYVFCGANVMFGPWISYEIYILPHRKPTKKSVLWGIGILRAVFLAVFFLSVSNCWTSYFIPDEANVLLVGYKEALSFRTSHYFICYFSEASMLAAGWKNVRTWNIDKDWNYTIVKPIEIELPTALATVVVNWNKPMHEFLKKYIYKAWLPQGKFRAVIMTFVISSFLHGFELKVSVVLISLGLFSYLQIRVRDDLASAFDICLRVHPCKDCHHKIKRKDFKCQALMVGFSLVTILHLIFLGVLMDPSTDEVGIYRKWKDLYFISLWIMFLNVLYIK